MTITDIIAAIAPPSQEAMTLCRQRWLALAKPLGGLGALEEIWVDICGITCTPHPTVAKKAVVVMCADHGVVEEGVSQTVQEVTAVVTENIPKGMTSVCHMAKVAGATVVGVDVGVARPVCGAGLLQKNIRRGSRNMTKEPALTRDEAERAIMVGVEVAGELSCQGYHLIATGEMGIGNTTPASAVTAVLLDLPPSQVTGKGAGLSDTGLEKKIAAIETAIALSHPNPSDPLDVLAKVGGLDLAGMVGLYLGGAVHKMPILVDGVISMAAALLAVKLCPDVRYYLVASHATAEPAGIYLAQALALNPIIHGGLHLGEGTGAVALMPLLDMTQMVYEGMPTFQEIAIQEYKPL